MGRFVCYAVFDLVRFKFLRNKKVTNNSQGRPRGLVVRCACSATGGPSLDPGHAPTHRFSSHAEAASHIQQLEGCATTTYNYLLGLWGKKEEDWQ